MRGFTWRRRPRPTATLVAVVISGGVLALSAAPAAADTAPPVANTPQTVSADALPTVQINGVVWAQATIGNTVYATGSFTQARPAGAAPGVSETPRSNILAYDITTGVLNTTFAPALNAQGLAVVASPDGRTVYVGGDFTQVNGQNRSRIAALDAVTGALRPFSPGMNARVRSLAVNGNTLYAGGIFSTAANQARTRLAAFDAVSGQVQTWAPSADAEVSTLAVYPGSNKLFLGGKFTTINGTANRGLGSVDLTSGATVAFPANQITATGGTSSGSYGLRIVGDVLTGSGWSFDSSQGRNESIYSVDAKTGQLIYVSGCSGDTYDTLPMGGVVYAVAHAHNCTPLGGWPEQGNRARRAWAARLAAVPGKVNLPGGYGTFQGKPAPELLHWLPDFDTGTFTGQDQAAWSLAGNGQYLSVGGEFPKVNITAQQGLTRFALRTVAPNKEGPRVDGAAATTIQPVSAGVVTATFTAAYDRDNTRLRYDLLRGPQLGTAAVVATSTSDSNFWTRPRLTLTDSAAPPGTSQSYRVRTTDPLGNIDVGATVVVAVSGQAAAASGTAADTFERTVATGLGSATTGGAWTVAGAGTTSSVGAGSAAFGIPIGKAVAAQLGSVSNRDTDLLVTTWAEAMPTGGGVYLAGSVRTSSAGEYRGRARILSTGQVQAAVTRLDGATETALGTTVTVPGLTYTAGQKINIRTQAVGTGTTTVRVRVWAAGTAEPTTWQATATDTTAALQTAGGVGLYAYSSASSTAASVIRFDDLASAVTTG